MCQGTSGSMTCGNRKLFQTFGYRDALASILNFLGAMLAAGGGIGGGGVYVPVLILVEGLTTATAVPISQVRCSHGKHESRTVYNAAAARPARRL